MKKATVRSVLLRTNSTAEPSFELTDDERVASVEFATGGGFIAIVVKEVPA